jgi:hypothetical protein
MSNRAWLAVAAILALLVPLALVAVLAGWVTQVPKLSLTHVGIALLAILILGHLFWHPQGQDQRTLQDVEQRRAREGASLGDVLQILPHLLPESQRTHLLNLASEKTANCQGSRVLRGQLRRLCAMGLVQPKIGRRIRQITDGMVFDLGDYVELTPLGHEWVGCILAIEKAERRQGNDEGRGMKDEG